MPISYDGISVVLQGPIDWTLDARRLIATTRALSMNVRRLLPGAEIVLSTWDNQKYDSIDIDRVVVSKDPGPQGEWPSFVPTNINRQITSTVAGLKASKRPYCLKCRTDIMLESVKFLDVYSSLKPIPSDERRLFDRPIVSNNLTSRNTSEILSRLPDHPLLFHPSDHIHFGLREDLLRLWDVPLQSEKDAHFFVDRTQPNRWRYHELSRLAPEQHLLTSAIAKRIEIDFAHYAHHSAALEDLSEYYMNTHFHFVPDKQFEIHFPKYHTPHHFSFEWMRRNPDRTLLETTELQSGRNPNFTIGKRLTYPFRRPRQFAKAVGRSLGMKI